MNVKTPMDLSRVAHDLSSVISIQNFTAKLLEQSGLKNEDHALIFVRAAEARLREIKNQVVEQIQKNKFKKEFHLQKIEKARYE